MSDEMYTGTLAQKLAAVLESPFCEGADAWQAVRTPTDREFPQTIREIHYEEWGFVAGVAFGIARLDDPFEPAESVAARARAAAEEVFEWVRTWSDDRLPEPLPVAYGQPFVERPEWESRWSKLEGEFSPEA